MEWEIKNFLDKTDVEALITGLDQHRDPISRRDSRPFGVTVKTDSRIIGGASCLEDWGWMKVKLLWVDKTRRRQGLGTQIMSRIEAEAKIRDCTGVYLVTFNFQAPEFYQNLGYQIFGEMNDFPIGHKRIYFQKRFSPDL